VNDWRKEFVNAGALRLHDGKAARPHALLTSGLHSDGFVNCTMVTQRPALLGRILREADGLGTRLPTGVDWVIGSALGAVTFAYAVADRLNARAGFTEKDGDGMKLARFEIAPGEKVLVVEDVISTGGSTLKTLDGIAAATQGKAEILPLIVCLVNRSGKPNLADREIRALLSPDIKTWKPEECPLCRQGSESVRPKSHWKELTAV